MGAESYKDGVCGAVKFLLDFLIKFGREKETFGEFITNWKNNHEH